MEITLTKGQASDTVAFCRADGSGDSFDFPKKGPTPHDAFHYFVERELGMAKGFWGLVASGVEPGAIQQLAADAFYPYVLNILLKFCSNYPFRFSKKKTTAST